MSPSEIFAAYLKLLLRLFEYDVSVMSQGWMYWTLLIPIFVYLMFFIAKWVVLTAPITIPIYFAASLVRATFARESVSEERMKSDDKA